MVLKLIRVTRIHSVVTYTKHNKTSLRLSKVEQGSALIP